MNSNQTPKPSNPGEETLTGPIDLHFTNSGSVKTAGSAFKSDPQNKVVHVPQGAEITLRNKRSLEVKLNGINVNWSTDVINSIMKDGKKIF